MNIERDDIDLEAEIIISRRNARILHEASKNCIFPWAAKILDNMARDKWKRAREILVYGYIPESENLPKP